jgi:hypothetical protein
MSYEVNPAEESWNKTGLEPPHLRDFWQEKNSFFFVRTEHHTRKNSSVSLLIDASDAAQWIDAIHSECKSASALFNWSIIT